MGCRKVETANGTIEMSAVGALERAVLALVKAEQQADEGSTVTDISTSGAAAVTEHPKWLEVAKEWHDLALTLAQGYGFEDEEE